MPLAINEVGVRETFAPRPGCAFVDIDIEALEMVTLAQVEIWTIKDDTKAKQINSGLDLHCITGASLVKTDYRNFFRAAKGKDPQEKSWRGPVDKTAANSRNLSKVPNFGKPGGMADETLVGFARTSYGIRLGATPERPRPTRAVQEEEARRIGEAWRRANPNDMAYLEFMRSTRGRDGRYYVVIGHPSIGHMVRRGKCTYCAACNSPFQGLGALVAGAITWQLQKTCYTDRRSPLFGSRMVMHGYDQWLCEVPLDRITDAAAALEDIVCRGDGKKMVPDVTIRAEAAAMKCWSKSAETVRDADGTLLVWGTPEADERLRQIKGEK